MKFLIIGDLHGHIPNIYFKEFDAIIAPGDFCSDAMRPWMFKAFKTEYANARIPVHWYDLTGRRKAKKMIQRSLADGRAVLEYLNSLGVPVYAVPGNWEWSKSRHPDSDWPYIKQDHYKKLFIGLQNVINVHHQRVSAHGYNFIGHGFTSGPEYPQDDEEKKRLQSTKKLSLVTRDYKGQRSIVTRLFQQAKQPLIFMPHNVPYNTPLDLIDNPASPRNGKHFGSVIAREIVDTFQPVVCIGGHMHEHFTACRLGKTLCINAGFGSDVNVLLEIDGTLVKKVEFCKKGKIVQTIS